MGQKRPCITRELGSSGTDCMTTRLSVSRRAIEETFPHPQNSALSLVLFKEPASAQCRGYHYGGSSIRPASPSPTVCRAGPVQRDETADSRDDSSLSMPLPRRER